MSLLRRYSSLLIILFFLAVSIQFTLSNVRLLSQNPGGDFMAFYQAGQLARQKQNPYLPQFDSSQVRNPPPAFLLFMLFPFFPPQTTLILFFIASLVAFLTGLFLIFRLTGTDFKYIHGVKTFLLAISLCLLFFPLRYALGSSHINILTFLFLVLTFYFLQKRDSLLTGLSLSSAVVFSITPIFLLLVFLLKKKIRLILWTAAWLTILSIVTFLLLGREIFQSYFTVPNSYINLSDSVYYNQSLAAFLARIINSSQIILITYLVFILIGLGYFVKTTAQLSFEKFNQSLIIFNFSIIYILIFAPFAWQYHYIISVFPLIATLYLALKTRQTRIFYSLLALSYTLIGFNIKNTQIFSSLDIIGSIILSHVLLGAFLLLILNYSIAKQLLKTS